MEFPSLFEIANNGKEKVWNIQVIDDINNNIANIITEYGYVNGKMIKNIKNVNKGKNIGKRNETTYLEQSINDAKTLFLAKKSAGYREKDDNDLNITNNSKETYQNIPNPMLAHNYTDHYSKIKFPCFIQPKIDGIRCLALPNNGLYSRNKKIFNNLDYILKEVNSINMILDGELFSDKISFQEIISITKTESKKEVEKIYLYVYDVIIDNKSYEERFNILKDIFNQNNKFGYIKLLQTEICNDKNFIDIKHDEYVKYGHEGIMIKNMNSFYEGKRSYNLQKYKKFFDKEYEIINFTEGKGLEKDCVIWMCKNENNKQFSCRPIGTRDERKELFKNGKEYIGKYLTVKYQNMTDDGLPRFPIGLSIRDYE